MRGPLKIVVHVLVFGAAVVVFYLGLGIGLAFNPIIGTVLWIVAAGIAVLNAFWILRSTGRKALTGAGRLVRRALFR